MEAEKLLDGITETTEQEPKRERLIALVAGGHSKHYFGKELSIDKIEAMKTDEIHKLYSRYEARLGSEITKTLGNTIIQLYSQIASRFLPINDQSHLVTDLESDPFIGHALNSFTCRLYHRFGMFLAPLTTAITTIKHINIKDNNGRSEGTSNQESEEGRGGKESSSKEKSQT